MKSPGAAARLASARNKMQDALDGRGDEEERLLRVVSKTRSSRASPPSRRGGRRGKAGKRPSAGIIPRRNVTLTNSSSSSESRGPEQEDEEREGAELAKGDEERDAADERSHGPEDDEGDDEEGSCYSAGSEGSADSISDGDYTDDEDDGSSPRRGGSKPPRRGRILRALNLPGALGSRLRRRRRRLRWNRRRARGDLAEDEGTDDGYDEDSYSSGSRYGSRSTYSSRSGSSGDDESAGGTTDEDDEGLDERESEDEGGDEFAVDPEVAAEELRRDLEARGYNLNCESFITKDSSVDPAEERYARVAPPPRRQQGKKREKSKPSKPAKKKGASRDELSGNTEEETSVGPVPAELQKKERDDASEKRSIKAAATGVSVGSLSNPSDAIEKQSLKTNTSSKLARSERAASTQKYGQPLSPLNMESLASLREFVDVAKKHKRTIAPPAITMYEAKHPRTKNGPAKSPIPKTGTADDAESIAAMSGDDDKAGKKNAKSPKKADQEKKIASKKDGGKRTPTKSSKNAATSNAPPAATDPDVIIEGMSVVMANQSSGKRREGIEPYKQVLPDPPEEEEREAGPLPRAVVIPPPKPQWQRQQQQHRATTATLTTATALTSPGHGTQLDASLPPVEAQPPLEKPKKRFFALPQFGRRQDRGSVPRIPNLPQTPKPTVVDLSKTPRNEASGKRFQLPEAIITRTEAKEVPSRQQATTPTAFKLPSSIRESAEPQQMASAQDKTLEQRAPSTGANSNRRMPASRERSSAQRLSPVKDVVHGLIQEAKKTFSPKKPSINRFFATVGSTDHVQGDEETMAPGQIEVTFDSRSMIEGDLMPVGRVEVAPPTPRRWNPLSPRSRDPPPGALPVKVPDPPAERREQNTDHRVPITTIASPRERVVSLRLLRQPNPPPPPPAASEPKRPLPRFTLFSRHRKEGRAAPASEPAKAVQQVPPDRSVQGSEAPSSVVIKNVKVWSNDSTFHGLEDVLKESRRSNVPTEDRDVQNVPEHEQAAAPMRTTTLSLDRVRSAPVTRSDLKTAVQDLITTVFHPEKLAEAERLSNHQPTKTGTTQDWFHLDLLGNLDWAATRSTDKLKAERKGRHDQGSRHEQKKSYEKEIDRAQLPSSTVGATRSPSYQTPSLTTQTHSHSLLTESNPHSLVDHTRTQSLQTQTRSFVSQSLRTEGNQRTLNDRACSSHLGTLRGSTSVAVETSRALPTSAVTSLETVVEGNRMESKPRKGMLSKLRNNAGKKTEPSEDRMSIGISSGEPSSNYFHVEYNDDNDLKASNIRPAIARPSLSNKKRVEVPPRHQVPVLVDSPACNNVHRGQGAAKNRSVVPRATPKSEAAVNVSRTRNLANSATLTTIPTGTDAGPGALNIDSYLRSDTSSDADTWAEIADASMVVERAMEKLDTFRSDDDTEDPAKLKYLLSVVSDEDTIGDVEKALNTLKKHASRLGVKETDLLLAVTSQGGTPRSNGTAEESDTRSEKSMTLGEELLNIFGMFVNPQAQSKRHRRGKSSRRNKKPYTYR